MTSGQHGDAPLCAPNGQPSGNAANRYGDLRTAGGKPRGSSLADAIDPKFHVTTVPRQCHALPFVELKAQGVGVTEEGGTDIDVVIPELNGGAIGEEICQRGLHADRILESHPTWPRDSPRYTW